ncbi:MAG: 3-hydroxyacyl-CoA dehydrogenase NAD-binding domain-containing protein [Nocardioidaceae bacterium]
MGEQIKADLRRLELLGKPVVAAINGAALGGGLEITLACHHRIAVDDNKIDLGLPEVTLGLLPGGGGVTRTVRMLGLQSALMDVLLQGPRFKPAKAKEKGLIDDLVATQDELVPAARKWILENKDNEEAASQPWDRKGYKMPGGSPTSPALAGFLPAFPAILRKQIKGADYPAPKAILSAAVEGCLDRCRHRVKDRVALSGQSDHWLECQKHDHRLLLQPLRDQWRRAAPKDVPKFTATKVGVLGAGMMGAGIAYSCAKAGMHVVLKDVTQESADKGKAYSEKLLDKAISRGRSTEEKKAELLGRITATTDPQEFKGCDLVIEAVFEDPSLKAQVFSEIQDIVNADALLCSNTSTLPITELAKGVNRPADFVGLHFFSPVDKMPLVEIIKGKETSDESVARALDVVQQMRKTPIVVNDSRGFYTSRVIGTMVNEGLAMLAEGVHPMSVERAATRAGYPVGTLQLSDELNMELMAKIRKATKDAAGADYVAHPADDVVEKMIEAGRPGRLRGAGFYDYTDGQRGKLWPGLAELFPDPGRARRHR